MLLYSLGKTMLALSVQTSNKSELIFLNAEFDHTVSTVLSA